MPVGRPPKFSSPDELQEAFESWKLLFDEGAILHGQVPDIEGFCNYIDAWRDLLCEYEKKEAFTDTIKRIKNWIYSQKKQLAFSGKMPPAVFIFDAKNNAGYTDRQELDHTTNGKDLGVAISATQAEQLIRARAERRDT